MSNERMGNGHLDDGPDRRPPPPEEEGGPPAPVSETAPEPTADAEQLADLKAHAVDLEDRWRRALADLDNLRKRVARDMAAQRAEERVRVAAELLPVLDNLDLALEHAESDPGGIVEGVRAVRDQAVGVLARLGFPRHDDVGVPFDPARHEAVSVIAGTDAPDGTVVQVLRPGYGDARHQLRPAAVVVAKKAD
jgi:molecular chaperone GrpE